MRVNSAEQQPRGVQPAQQTIQPQPVGTGTAPNLLPYGITLSSSTAVLRTEQTLEFLALDHLAIRVADLRRAESFYHEFFQMDVLVRARRAHDHWEAMPFDYDYVEGLRAGYLPEIVQLRNSALSLVLINAGRGAVIGENRFAHVGLRVSRETLTALRAVALVRNFTVAQDDPDAFRFNDPFGITWHLTTGEGQGT